MIKFEIKNRFTGDVQCTAEIDCSGDTGKSLKMGLAVTWAIKNEIDLRGANLRGANLRGANLEDADLRGADLRDADLEDAYLRGADLGGADLGVANLRGANLEDADLEKGPVIGNIHQKVYEAVKGGEALNMSDWHDHCGTKHCRAGWVVTLAGKEGKELEEKIGTPAAAYVIYKSSDPDIKAMPDFYCSDEEAMEDIIACAEKEKSKA